MPEKMGSGAPTASGGFEKVGECLYRYKPSGTYYARIRRGSKEYRQSLKTTDRALAQRRLAEYRNKVARLTLDAGSKHIAFKELAERWFSTIQGDLKPASARRRAVSIHELCRKFGSTPIRNIGIKECEDWVIGRGAKISASTFNKERETLIAVFEYAKRHGLILDNPASNLERRRSDASKLLIPTRDDFSRLIKALSQMDLRAREAMNLVELLAYSGMRLAEATNILWSDIDFERGLFTVTGGENGTKNWEKRVVPLFPAMRELLDRLKMGNSLGPHQRIISITTAKRALATACKRAVLPDFTHHSLRHYFVSNAIEAGIDFKVIAGWVGHKDGGVLVAKTYGHLRDEHSFEMAKRMVFSAQAQLSGLLPTTAETTKGIS